MQTKFVPDELYFDSRKCECEWIDFLDSGMTFAVTSPIKCYPTLRPTRENRKDVLDVSLSWQPGDNGPFTGDFVVLKINPDSIPEYKSTTVMIRLKSGDGFNCMQMRRLNSYSGNSITIISRQDMALRYLTITGIGDISKRCMISVSTQCDDIPCVNEPSNFNSDNNQDLDNHVDDDYVNISSVGTYRTERSVGSVLAFDPMSPAPQTPVSDPMSPASPLPMANAQSLAPSHESWGAPPPSAFKTITVKPNNHREGPIEGEPYGAASIRQALERQKMLDKILESLPGSNYASQPQSVTHDCVQSASASFPSQRLPQRDIRRPHPYRPSNDVQQASSSQPSNQSQTSGSQRTVQEYLDM